jgi:general L-amino acid transport system permease protein
MDAVPHEVIAARPAPARNSGPGAWLRANLFSDWQNALATLIILLVAARYLPGIFQWAVTDAITVRDAQACRALGHGGACWGVIAEKYRFVLFGRFPYDEQWRPLVATAILVGLLVASAARRFWRAWLALVWIAGLAAFFLLMRGGLLGMSPVETERWGGFPLTMILTTLGIAAALPLAVLVALGRRSHLPAIRAVCTVYIELVRGVPLVSVLFMASFMFPLFMPAGYAPDVLLRVLAGIILFAAAYLAETVRGGLQAVPAGQYEAAAALGLSYWQMQRKIVLPQALRIVVPGLVNSFISTYKDTSLVTIVGLYELTGALGLALRGDAEWRQFYFEGYLFIGLIYWIGCFAMSHYSQRMERALSTGNRR